MRLTVAKKIAIGLSAISVIGIGAMLFIYAGLNTVERIVHKIASDEEPFNAAAYEMEVNVNGIGFAVSNYLATRNPQDRAWVAEDHIDFGNYHATYMRLTKTARETGLGERVGALYAEFKTLGDGLMQKQDQQEDLFTKVSTNIENIDQIIDRQLEPAIKGEGGWRTGRFEKSIVTASLEADIAELGFWVASYVRTPKPASKALIRDKLQEFREGLVRNSLNLNAEEQRLAGEIQSVFEQTADSIYEVVALEDFIVANHQRFIDLRLAMDQLFDNEIQPRALRALDLPRKRAERAAERVQRNLLYLILGFLLSAGLIGVLFIRSITQPLNRLKEGTEVIGLGDFAYRIPRATNDEFGDLASRFNQMSEQLESTTVSKALLQESETKLQQTVMYLRHEIGERESAEAERARLEVDLRRSETMSAMGALTAGVAHEVRNPLFGISSTLDAMEARFGSVTDFHRYVDVLQREVNRMNKLMGDLLEYGKPTTLELVSGSVKERIAQAVNACLPLAENLGVEITQHTRPDIPLVLTDRRRLVQVFQNLLENALHYSPRGGRVAIAAQAVGEAGKSWVECVIRDSGPGFKLDDLPHIFEPFFTRRGGGTGLGLSIVQRIVEAHGGFIVAANRVEGGAVVIVRLPVAPTSAHAAPTSAVDVPQ